MTHVLDWQRIRSERNHRTFIELLVEPVKKAWSCVKYRRIPNLNCIWQIQGISISSIKWLNKFLPQLSSSFSSLSINSSKLCFASAQTMPYQVQLLQSWWTACPHNSFNLPFDTFFHTVLRIWTNSQRSWNGVWHPIPCLPNVSMHATSSGLFKACMSQPRNALTSSMTSTSTRAGWRQWTAALPPDSPVIGSESY